MVVSIPLKNRLFPIYGKTKHVPNHQPVNRSEKKKDQQNLAPRQLNRFQSLKIGEKSRNKNLEMIVKTQFPGEALS